MNFFFNFVAPYMSLIEMGRTETVEALISNQFSRHCSQTWEKLCRSFVSGNLIDGILYNMARRWWGKDKEGHMMEFDVVAESIDKKHLLVGECKWTSAEDASRLLEQLKAKTSAANLAKKGQQTHYVLFLKEAPTKCGNSTILLPDNII